MSNAFIAGWICCSILLPQMMKSDKELQEGTSSTKKKTKTKAVAKKGAKVLGKKGTKGLKEKKAEKVVNPNRRGGIYIFAVGDYPV